MSFVERVSTLAGAREILGVAPGASVDEIRAAWKRVAFETHPDRNGGEREAFDRAKSAYARLMEEHPAPSPKPPEEEVEEEPSPARSEVQRPQITARIEPLSEAAIAACARLLQTHERFPGAAPRDDFVHLGTRNSTGAHTDHVPVSVKREGRDIVFVVAGLLSEGLNRVALPSAELSDRRKIVPRIVVFNSPKAGTGQVVIPASMLQRVVPGARSVRIRFAGAPEAPPADDPSAAGA